MTFLSLNLRWLNSPRIRRLLSGRAKVVVGLVVLATAAILWRTLRSSSDDPPARLSAAASKELNDAVNLHRLPFAASVVESIKQQGYATVTVHVALSDRRKDGKSTKSGNGNDPAANLYWGARHGVEAHMIKAEGWRRVYEDKGDGKRIIRRVVLQRRVEPTDAWRARDIDEPFDLYVLANAWPAGQIAATMEQPLRDAFAAKPVMLSVEGRKIQFGSGSVMTGYIGKNAMLDRYWDPFADLSAAALPRQTGIFYICSRSAVVLYAPVVQHGLYPILFTREPIVPEAYLLDGLLKALAKGDLDVGFLTSAAGEYARFQKDVSPRRAEGMLYR
jgi:hypothetical protein